MIGDYDYSPKLLTVILWIIGLLIFGALVGHYLPAPDDLTSTEENI